jgi:hypothetical protein
MAQFSTEVSCSRPFMIFEIIQNKITSPSEAIVRRRLRQGQGGSQKRGWVRLADLDGSDSDEERFNFSGRGRTSINHNVNELDEKSTAEQTPGTSSAFDPFGADRENPFSYGSRRKLARLPLDPSQRSLNALSAEQIAAMPSYGYIVIVANFEVFGETFWVHDFTQTERYIAMSLQQKVWDRFLVL